MTDVDRLLQTYIERFEAGERPDPSQLLDQTEGQDRKRLGALIEGYLGHAAPARQWDPAALEGSVAERAVEMLEESWEAEASALPAQLVALRKERKLKRTTLVERLAEAIGFAGETDRVAAYYNAMEHGQLEPRGVSERVFDALGSILGTSADALRKAGEAVAPSAGGEAAPAFARTVRVPAAAADAASPGRNYVKTEEQREPDELDRLFTGGD